MTDVSMVTIVYRDVSKIEDVVRTMNNKKKKMVPMRPAPYNAKTPPLPPRKTKKSVKLKDPPQGGWEESGCIHSFVPLCKYIMNLISMVN